LVRLCSASACSRWSAGGGYAAREPRRGVAREHGKPAAPAPAPLNRNALALPGHSYAFGTPRARARARPARRPHLFQARCPRSPSSRPRASSRATISRHRRRSRTCRARTRRTARRRRPRTSCTRLPPPPSCPGRNSRARANHKRARAPGTSPRTRAGRCSRRRRDTAAAAAAGHGSCHSAPAHGGPDTARARVRFRDARYCAVRQRAARLGRHARVLRCGGCLRTWRLDPLRA
jgi:hypothetical protein